MAEEGGKAHPRRETLLTATKGACALTSRLGKCAVVEIDRVNQRSGQLTSLLGGKTDLSRWIRADEGWFISLFVRQCISSVLGIEKPPPRPVLLA